MLLLVASRSEYRPANRQWGTGGWLVPEEREGLDWLCLARLLGWPMKIVQANEREIVKHLSQEVKWIVLACDPEECGEKLIRSVERVLETQAVLVVGRVAPTNATWANLSGVTHQGGTVCGHAFRWTGPGTSRTWMTKRPLKARCLELSYGAKEWATLDEVSVIAARSVGRGYVATIGFHPSEARDHDGSVTAVLRNLLICGAQTPSAWLDFENTIVLRMDDPGGAQNIHSRAWSYRKLGQSQWERIAADLKQRKARLSIGYVAGWVDDGDASRGELEVNGAVPTRVAGATYATPQVKYRDLRGHLPGVLHDYESEYRGVQSLRKAELADVELHGFTHMHPDTSSWATAPDRYESWPTTSWYRELGGSAQEIISQRRKDEHPLALGIKSFRRHFDTMPTTLICPGDQWTSDVVERAWRLGIQMISSYYLAFRFDQQFVWTQHICAPYLDSPDPAWFDSGLPVVGYFHDYELAVEGTSWLTMWLDAWQEAGARRLIDFRELAGALETRLHLEHRQGQLLLHVRCDPDAPKRVRPLPICVGPSDFDDATTLTAVIEGQRHKLPFQRGSDGLARVMLPASVSDGKTLGEQ